MDFQWQYNHLVIPLGISIVFVLALIVLGLRQRQNPIAKPYLFFMVCLLFWLITSLLESIILNLQISLIIADISFLAITCFPLAWLSVMMIYVGKGKQLPKILPWLVIIPILTNLMIWTNPLHQLWRGESYRDLTTTWFPITIYDYGQWFTVHLIFSLSITFAAMFLLVRSLFFRERAYRVQIITLLISLNLPLSIEILHWLGIDPIPHYNASILTFPISGLLTAWALLRHNFLDLMPIARDLVVDSMEDLMLVLDGQRRLVDVNSVARQRLFQGSMAVVGKRLDDLLPKQSQVIGQMIVNHTSRKEIEILQDNNHKIYEATLSPINHLLRGNSGWLLLLRDITSRKQAEEESYKQAQQVAILEERQRLARELHDSVSQTLFAAGLLSDLLPRAIDKKPEKIPEYATRIHELIHGASAEMRLVLLELYPDALIETDLGTVIKHLCDAFVGSTGTPLDFIATSQVHLEKDTQLAFYRIRLFQT
jgi:PAS domain S-box-containing protein